MRIVAGKHKGTKLFTFELDNIRPTLDIVREGVFNKIQFDIVDANVLDLFAGTGAFSLEALSRGAKYVVSVDKNVDSINLIHKNYSKCHEVGNIINSDFASAIRKLEGKIRFDIVFLDPPYASSFGFDALKLLSNSSIVDQDTLFIYETDDMVDMVASFDIVDHKKYGRVNVYFLKLQSR